MVARMSNREVEIKLRLPGVATGRRLLKTAGFRLLRARVFESNIVYDTPDESLRQAEKLLRVRQAGGEVILTYKGPSEPGRHKIREEIELHLSDAASFEQVLRRLGMEPAFRYEKYRTEYGDPGGDGRAMLDETPIGIFLELEGEPGWIDRTAPKLGFTKADYIISSYGRLFLETWPDAVKRPRHMTFDAIPGETHRE